MTDETDAELVAAVALARRFLALFEARDLEAAARHVDPAAEFVFPGGARHRGLATIAAGSGKRYAKVGKTIEGCDAGRAADGAIVVHVRGTLQGAWVNGSPFSGIRFIDRFEIRDGRITRQEVWNDSAEFRPRD